MTTRDGTEEFKQLETLAEEGKFKEALEKHIWFHEASRSMPGMGGVRLSYALDLWFELGKKYQPAMDALKGLRNTNRETLKKGTGNFENFHDLSAINQILEETQDTYELFLEIHDNFPKQAKQYYHVAEKLIVENKAYDICAHYIVDPMVKFSEIKHMHEMNVNLIRKNPEMDSDDFNLYTRERYINEVCQLIEIMVAVSEDDMARKIKEKALAYFDDQKIRSFKCHK